MEGRLATPVCCRAPQPTNSSCLRIASFNIRGDFKNTDAANGDSWEHRRSAVVELLDAYDPSIVGLQEPMRWQLGSLAKDSSALHKWIGYGRKYSLAQSSPATVCVLIALLTAAGAGFVVLSVLGLRYVLLHAHCKRCRRRSGEDREVLGLENRVEGCSDGHDEVLALEDRVEACGNDDVEMLAEEHQVAPSPLRYNSFSALCTILILATASLVTIWAMFPNIEASKSALLYTGVFATVVPSICLVNITLLQFLRPCSLYRKRVLWVWCTVLIGGWCGVGARALAALTGGEYTAILYDPARLRLVDGSDATVWLSESQQPGSISWGALDERTFTRGLFCPAAGENTGLGYCFWAINTHLSRASRKARVKSAAILAAEVRRLRAKSGSYPVLLMGDFNSAPGYTGDAYEVLRTEHELADTFFESHTGHRGGRRTWNGFVPPSPSMLTHQAQTIVARSNAIDHVLLSAKPGAVIVRDHAFLLDVTEEGRQISDHFCVLVTIC